MFKRKKRGRRTTVARLLKKQNAERQKQQITQRKAVRQRQLWRQTNARKQEKQQILQRNGGKDTGALTGAVLAAKPKSVLGKRKRVARDTGAVAETGVQTAKPKKKAKTMLDYLTI